MVRTGAAKASVGPCSGRYRSCPGSRENRVPYEEETLIQREIYLDGKNVCRVNGQLLSVPFCGGSAFSSSTSMAKGLSAAL